MNTSALRERISFCALAVVLLFASSAVAEGYKYESRGKRDPFVPLVGIDRPAVSKLQDITSIADIKLEGIATGAKGKLIAILNGEIVKEGDRFGVIEIGAITRQNVKIRIGGIDYEKKLIEDGGNKSGR